MGGREGGREGGGGEKLLTAPSLCCVAEVIVIDEIGTVEECLAARTIAQRGVQLVATAHGAPGGVGRWGRRSSCQRPCCLLSRWALLPAHPLTSAPAFSDIASLHHS